MSKDPWHYPRAKLAEQTYNLLMQGPAQAVTLFAPRRTGKTEFLLQDLGPLAEQKKHRVIYVSFWQAPLSPLAVLLHALERSRKSGSFGDRAREAMTAITPKLKLSAPTPLGKGEVEVDLTSLPAKPPAELLLHMDELIGRLSSPKHPLLLLLDEVQELSRDEKNESLIAALRTTLDKRASDVRAVFTGSSREGLAAMFSAREAPFFHFATSIDLPPLEEAFVEHSLKAFQAATKRKLDKGKIIAAFEALHRNPFFFRRFLELLLIRPDMKIDEALKQVREKIAEELGYPATWLGLSDIQRAVAVYLARGGKKPFTENARCDIGELMHEGPPTAARVQAALRKLSREMIADNYSGAWTIEDPEFSAWILQRSDI